MSDCRKCWVVIPALEPPPELLDWLKHLTDEQLPCLVVDDGSPEASEEIFRQINQLKNCVLLRHKHNLGKGRALKTAFAYLLEHAPDTIGAVSADCDGQHTVQDILRCVEALQQNPEKLILGCREFDRRSTPLRNYLGNYLSAWLFRKYLHCPVRDTQSGLRGIPCSFMKILLDKPGDGYEFETLMLLESRRAANGKTYPIHEVTVSTLYNGQSSHFRPLLDSWKILKIMLKKQD